MVNAAYNNRLIYDWPGSPDPSIRNTFERYLWNEQTCRDQIIYNVLKYSRGHNATYHDLCGTVLTANNSIFLLDADDFVWHWCHALDRNINDWLLVGQAWRNCIHFRPMGLKRFQQVSREYGINFYVSLWSVLDDDGAAITHDDLVKDDLCWQQVSDECYKLIA